MRELEETVRYDYLFVVSGGGDVVLGLHENVSFKRDVRVNIVDINEPSGLCDAHTDLN